MENFNFIKEKKTGNQVLFSLYKKPSYLILSLFILIFLEFLLGMIIYLNKTVFVFNFSVFFGVLLVLIVFTIILYYIYIFFDFIFSPFPYKTILTLNLDSIELRKINGIWIQNKLIKKKT